MYVSSFNSKTSQQMNFKLVQERLVCLRRDLFSRGENCFLGERPVFLRRELFFWRETCFPKERLVFLGIVLYVTCYVLFAFMLNVPIKQLSLLRKMFSLSRCSAAFAVGICIEPLTYHIQLHNHLPILGTASLGSWV